MSTPQVERVKVGWSFWAQWMLAAAVGFIAGTALSLGTGAALATSGVPPDSVSPVFSGLLNGLYFGLGMGTTQWLVLRRRIDRITGWILASIVGWIALWVVTQAVVDPLVPRLGLTGNLPAGMVGGAVLGVLLAIPQWRVLRDRVGRAERWVLINAVAGAAMVATGIVIDSPFLGLLVGVAIVQSALTGIGMLWLLRLPGGAGSRELDLARELDRATTASRNG